jgi:hypothetical protein
MFYRWKLSVIDILYDHLSYNKLSPPKTSTQTKPKRLIYTRTPN